MINYSFEKPFQQHSSPCKTGSSWKDSCTHILLKHIVDNADGPIELLGVKEAEIFHSLSPEEALKKLAGAASEMLTKLSTEMDHIGPDAAKEAAGCIYLAVVTLAIKKTGNFNLARPTLESYLPQSGKIDPRLPSAATILNEIEIELL